MSTSIYRITPRPASSGRRQRTDFSSVADDSPYAPYLRQWLAHRAAQHQSLLLNINAATRLGLAPTLVGR
jgi:hypothetical protein